MALTLIFKLKVAVARAVDQPDQLHVFTGIMTGCLMVSNYSNIKITCTCQPVPTKTLSTVSTMFGLVQLPVLKPPLSESSHIMYAPFSPISSPYITLGVPGMVSFSARSHAALPVSHSPYNIRAR